MPIGTTRRVVRRVTPPPVALDTELEALSQEALISLVLFQRSRVAELEAERLGLVRLIVSQQRRLRDERVVCSCAASRGESAGGALE